MRKLAILGMGALAAVTVAAGQVVPAGAVIVPPGLVQTQVCNALPAGLGGVFNLLAANVNLAAILGDGLADATADLEAKTEDLVDALLDHILAVDGGGNVAVTAAVVSARVAAYADSAAVWTKAWKDLDASELQAQVLAMQQSVLEDIQAALCEAEQPD